MHAHRGEGHHLAELAAAKDTEMLCGRVYGVWRRVREQRAVLVT